MAYSPIIFTVLICIISGAFADIVPVLMWGRGSQPTPALGNAQERLIETVTKSQLTLAFVEDELTTEDISLCKVELQGSCFSYLSNVRIQSYSQISQPIDRIEDVVKNVQYVRVDKNGNLDTPLKEASFVIFQLTTDPALSREENLEKHDGYINKIYNDVIADIGENDVLALYTGKSSGNHVRKPRQIQEISTAAPVTMSTSTSSSSPVEADNKEVIIQKPELLMYYTAFTLTDKQDTTPLTASGLTISNKNDSAFLVTIATQAGDIKFKVSNVAGYWGVGEVEFKNATNMMTERTVGAADGFSYYCGQYTNYTNQDYTLSWVNLQMQPVFGNLTVLAKFGDPYNCVGFTSIPIWSGLFVTVVLLFIMSTGITWLMDIRTMDRFDDPKGKTIAINTLE